MRSSWTCLAVVAAALCACSEDDSGPCRADHDPAGCPATYDLAGEALKQCVPSGQMLAFGLCPNEQLRFMQLDTGTHGLSCFYDAVTGQSVGSARYNDVASYCGYRSFSVVYGAVPTTCDDRQVDGRGTTCAELDAGTDGSAALDGATQ